MNPFQHIYQRYVDEAAFLWVLRDIALHQPHYSVDDLRELEERIRRQLNGIMTAPEDAWLECEEALVIGEAGEIFTAAVTAFRCGHGDKINKVVEFLANGEEVVAGFSSALDFLPDQLCHKWIKKFFTSKDLLHNRVALEACLLRGEDPAGYLNKIVAREASRADIPLFASCLKVMGQFKRSDLCEIIDEATKAEDPAICFNALRTQILIGNHNQLKKLATYVMEGGEYQYEAIQLAFRLLPPIEARQWISALVANENNLKSAVMAMAVFGDPQVINWLLAQMEQPELAKVTAEAFATITGLDLDSEGLSQDEPEMEIEFDEEEFIALDEDEHLPYPNIDALRQWWLTHGSCFVVGTRYFLGQEVNDIALREQIAQGFQRRRHQAALELALRNPTEALINTLSFNKT